MAKAKVTNDGKKGGNVGGKPHTKGGVPVVIQETGKIPSVELGEVIINKYAAKKHWKKLSKINQSAGDGVPIVEPKFEKDNKVVEAKYFKVIHDNSEDFIESTQTEEEINEHIEALKQNGFEVTAVSKEDCGCQHFGGGGNLDSHMEEFEQEQSGRVDATPAIVTETLSVGNELVNKDYLPQIRHITEIHPFIEHIKELNPYNLGWRFQFGSSREWAGLCEVGKELTGKSPDKNIYVSIKYVKHDANWKSNMSGVILHEIAHAIIRELFYYENGELNLKSGDEKMYKLDDLHKISKGHGVIWKKVCGAINGNECRIHLETAKKTDKFKPYKYDCSFCGHEGYGDNKRFTQECSKCNKSVLIEANIS